MFDNLRFAFQKFEESYVARKGEEADRAAETKAAEVDESEPLISVLAELEAVGYQKRELTFILNIEPLTFDRWKSGKGSMKPETFRDFQRTVYDILDGKPQRPVILSDTGLFTWQHVFEERQPKAKCIWYVTEGRFLLNRSPEVKRAVRNLFLTAVQEQKNLCSPTIVYLYPSNGLTADSLDQWKKRVNESGENKLFRGTVIGIGITKSLPWFQPGIRTIILEMDDVSLEGYLRIKLAPPFQGNMLRAFGTEENSQHIQWISVASETVAEWQDVCESRYGKYVDGFKKRQEEEKTPFAVYTLDVD